MSSHSNLTGQMPPHVKERDTFLALLYPPVISGLIRKMHPVNIITWIADTGRNFSRNFREALVYRKQASLPGVNLLIALVMIFTSAYILAAIYFVPEGMQPEFHFKNESGLITPMSSFFLAMASAFAIAALVVNMRGKQSQIWLWVVMAMGFTFLSFDELIQFHERTGNVLKHHASSGIFRNWNDIIVILYGVIALPLMALFLPSILRYRMLLELLAAAFIFYGIHTLIDSTTDIETTIPTIIEESAKLFCVSSLALSAFVGFLGSLWNFELPGGLKNDA